MINSFTPPHALLDDKLFHAPLLVTLTQETRFALSLLSRQAAMAKQKR